MKRTVTLNKIYVNRESKDGKKYKTPMVSIYFNKPDGTEQRASGFVQEGNPALEWQKGETMELDFEKKGDFVNFVLPKPVDLLAERVAKLEQAVFGAKPQPVVPKTTVEVAKEVFEVERIKAEDLPF